MRSGLGKALQRLFLVLFVMLSGSAHATTAVVFDAETGQVLHDQRADQPWYPASLTKLMTAYVAFEVVKKGNLTGATKLRLSEHANSQEPTKLWLRTDTELTLATTLGAMIVKSANDAAVMLAEGVGGELARFSSHGACIGPNDPGYERAALGSPPHPTEMFRRRPSGLGAARYDDAIGPWTACRYDAFIRRMNTSAQRLGMTATTFANANGLPDARQVTTARDLALLARALIREYPEYGHIFSAKSMRYHGGRLRSYNRLLRTFAGADGMKTGFICASGYNIVASATRSGQRVVAVVLGWSGAASRNARAAALLRHGLAAHPTRFGPHDVQISQLTSLGNAMMPPQDIRASLRSRNCRRGPGWRIRFRERQVNVRALNGPSFSRVPLPEKNVIGADTSKSASASTVARPTPARVKRKRKSLVANKRSKSGKKKVTNFSASGVAHETASQR